MHSESLKQCFQIFSECFDFVPLSERIFAQKLKNCDFIFRFCGSRMTGFAATERDSVALVCVHPDFQKKGIGTSLLSECEKNIILSGYNKSVLGRIHSDFFWGAVINNMSHHFFEKHGYEAFNGCLNMFLYTEDFSYEKVSRKFIIPENTRFIISDGSRYDEIITAVNEVEPKWKDFFRHKSGKDIILAEQNGNIAGFMTVEYDSDTIISDDESRTGLLGYVGVVPAARKQGIGRSMVAYATELIKKSGCTEAFINYTSLDTWYSALGYEEYLWFWMGEKFFKHQ